MTTAPAWVLLDRDGTINVAPPAGEYVTRPEDLRLLPGAAEAIAALNRHGVGVAVVTNQRGVALGRMTMADVDRVHARLAQELARHGARVDAIYVCPHHEGACACRKPRPGLLLRAGREHGIDLARAVLVGDSETDVEAGRRAGTRTILLGGEPGARTGADAVRPTLASAVAALLGDDGRAAP